MVLGDADPDAVGAGVHRQDDIKDNAVVHRLDVHGHLRQKRAQPGFLLAGHGRDDLEGLVGLASYDAGGGRRFDALQAVGVGHHHTFDVFDDVAADPDLHPVGHGIQHLTRLGGGIGNGDGLGAAHGGDQLFFQDLYIGPIGPAVLFHRSISFWGNPPGRIRKRRARLTDTPEKSPLNIHVPRLHCNRQEGRRSPPRENVKKSCMVSPPST